MVELTSTCWRTSPRTCSIMKAAPFVFLFLLGQHANVAAADQCWQGATFSETIISPNLKSGNILRVPEAPSSAQCAEACCELPSCDLAWFFERRCYVLSCLHPEDCQPRQRPGADSHVTFLRRGLPPALVLQSLVRGQPYGGRWRPLPRPKGAATLKDLALFSGIRDFDDLGAADAEYPEGYRSLEDGGGIGVEGRAGARVEAEPVKVEQKESSGYLDWPPLLGRDGLNLSEVTGGPAERESLQDVSQDDLQLLSPSPMAVDDNEVLPTVPSPAPSSIGSTLQDLGVSGVSSSLALNDSTSSASAPPTAPPPNITSDSASEGQIRTSIPTESPPPVSSAASPTSAPQQVRTLLVSLGDPVEVTLPRNTVHLVASVISEPQTENAYDYEWSFLSFPPGHQGVMEGQHSKSMKLTGLSRGDYLVKVAVTRDGAYGEGVVNVTVRPAARINWPPTAVASPQTQDVLLPASSAVIDGSRSTDDTAVVGYRWEQVGGPAQDHGVYVATPSLHLSHLEPGEYAFRLTVTDSEGLADSTVATVRVLKPVDLPPVADAGPNRTVSLPTDHVTLCGNRSSDDHLVLKYLWTLSPNSQAKEVTMQDTRTPHLQLSDLHEGVYTFQLTVTDSVGQQASSTASVIVEPESNSAPRAVVGPDQQLTLPVSATQLDGSGSTDDRGITRFRWEAVGGPPGLKIEHADQAVAIATGFLAGSYTFQLTVEDQQGATDSACLNITIKEGETLPPVAHAGDSHTLVLPNNSLVLRGAVSGADPASVSYLWVRDGESPAAGVSVWVRLGAGGWSGTGRTADSGLPQDVLYGSERWPSLHLANLVEGTYLFQLSVSDAQGRSSSATTSVEVLPDPQRQAAVELELRVPLSQVNQRQKDTLRRQIAALLHVPEMDVTLRGLHAASEVSTMLHIAAGPQGEPVAAPQLARRLRMLLLRERTDLLVFRVLRVEPVMCLLSCSAHGRCDPLTRRCVCEPFWMENPVRRFLQDSESNCDWSVLYVVTASFTAVLLVLCVGWACVCCCKRRKRTKVRKKTKYTILDNMDDQERMELRPKYNIKHRSTEHNSSLMMSESEFDSDQDTIFTREKVKNRSNGAARNGDAFSSRPVDG
ncbi:dyslexia-associated protein KIAA0319-like [Arapaima gigas]